MNFVPTSSFLASLTLVFWVEATVPTVPASQTSNPNSSQTQTQASQQDGGKTAETAARLPRGKKLVLKDGNFQLVRSYERKAERVRYFSVEPRDWEEIPAAMVDWEATAKAAAEAEKAAAEFANKVHKQEEATKAEMVMDIDASLQVAPGVFWPPRQGTLGIAGESG